MQIYLVISYISVGFFCGHIQYVRTNFIIAAANALGIGAASFGSAVYEASKDIAESPTA